MDKQLAVFLIVQEEHLDKDGRRFGVPYDVEAATVLHSTVAEAKRLQVLAYIDRLATALGCSIGDILAGTRAVVGDHTLSTLQEKVDAVTAERDSCIAENKELKEKVAALSAEVELLKMQLMHKEELLALHNYYNKLNPVK